ncbi:hypothetical protein EJ06DRAFT_257816 [Trichodelitschia bisporula]|uniref:Tannase/feruloyl esterase family alpha/beta hydrolase n=1 Tax=Trichodelitschia bisporula TaxID=703511 RepID=A0A6G1HIK7_9PEZI|nr:hypothetical protein EJ06DRAFT_257816 [Trichodelitschia bisporula]
MHLAVFTIVAALTAEALAAGTVVRRQNTTGVDPLYTYPYIDVDEWRDTPLRHRYVHGGFNGTELRFSFYFPPAEQYRKRFIQPLPAVSGNEKLVFEPAALGAIISDIAPFSFESGAYIVESNQGRQDMYPGDDATITGFRGSAAAARFSRELAAKMYGPHRPYGYVFGGSGGGYKTLACIENGTEWDGAVPFIIGSPVSIPSVFTVQAHAMRVLASKFDSIVDALEPGGSGDMYAGLDIEQRQALAEVTKFGFPPEAWFRHKKIASGYTGVFSGLLDNVISADPAYFDDFWKKPGYLGADPPASLVKARVQRNITIKRIVYSKEALAMGLPVSLPGKFAGGLNEVPAAFRLDGLPAGGELMGSTLTVARGEAKGTVLYLVATVGDLALVGFGAANFRTLSKIKAEDGLILDNANYLASQTYHRHINPGPEYPVWNQYQAAGKPIYPQRKSAFDGKTSMSGTGTLQSGKFSGKVIVIEAMMDEAAYPWQADWYQSQVKKHLGARIDDQFRLWMVERCMHTSPAVGDTERPAEDTRIVTYAPVIQQALRDLIQWVEKGVAPPPSSAYRVEDGQIVVGSAQERRGVQPVVTLTVNGKARADVKVGQAVEFAGTVEVPPGAGRVVATEFDFDGAGLFPSSPKFESTGAGTHATVKTSYAFTAPGTYFPALRGFSARGNVSSPFGRAHNLGRVRVVVS